MKLPDDLKDYRADDLGAFQVLTGDECVAIACILAALVAIFHPYI